jgi:hypothetical protein
MLVQSPILEHSAKYPGYMDDGLSRGTNWRDIFAEEDSGAIWESLLYLIESVATDEAANSLSKAQALFLSLLSNGSFTEYTESGFSNDEIEQELLSIAGTL